MTVEIRSLAIRANFSEQDDSNDEVEDKFVKALADAERRITQDMADMIAEAFRRREER